MSDVDIFWGDSVFVAFVFVFFLHAWTVESARQAEEETASKLLLALCGTSSVHLRRPAMSFASICLACSCFVKMDSTPPPPPSLHVV